VVTLEGTEPVAVEAAGGEHRGGEGVAHGRGGLTADVGVCRVQGVRDGQVEGPEKPGGL
jgi:hypothetical protein